MVPPDEGAATPVPVIDLHAHPSMKTYLGRATFGKRQKARSGFALTRLRTSYPSLLSGGVDVLCSCVSVPERQLKKDCLVIAIGGLVLSKLRRAMADPPDATTRVMLQHVAAEVAAVNATNPARRLEIVTSNAALDAALQAGRLVVIHTIEGGHSLAGNPANVAVFHGMGVAMLTIAHFYLNDVAAPVDAVPDGFFLKKIGCFRQKKDLTLGLLSQGPAVIEEMFLRGMVVDLTHCTPKAREEVYALPNPRKRPVVMSHVGAGSLRPSPMNPDDDEIRTIADTGGVVGVIFYNHWLTLPDVTGTKSDTLTQVVRHIERIVGQGGEDCVAIGSDFDGLTDPPDDLREPADVPNLAGALQAKGFSSAQVAKFLGGNFRRVLKDGWA